MDALRQIIPVLLTVSLAGLVLAVGLNSAWDDLLYVLRRPGRLFKGVLAVIVIPPIVAGIVVSLLPLQPVVKTGIMLMAVAPVPPLVPGKELAVGGRKEYAYGLYIAMALLTIVSVPIVYSIAAEAFGREDPIPIRGVAATVVGGVVVPLALGVLIRLAAPEFADGVWRLVYRVSMALVLAAFLPLLIVAWPAISALIGNGTVLAMAVVSAIAIAVGHMLGGPDKRDRATLAMASGVRHPGIAMLLAGSAPYDDRVKAAVLLFMLVGLIVAAPYQAWVKRGPEPRPHRA